MDLGGVDGYTGSVAADMSHRTYSMSGIVFGAKIFLVSNQEEVESANDPDIVDMIDYSFSVPGGGESLERKAFEDNICFSAQGNGEFSGNGCDTDDEMSDFEIRSVSKPQNSGSLPEPRDAPTAVANFSVDYHFSAPTVTMSWDESQDYTGATSTIAYEIEEINTPTSSTPFELNATSTALEQVIDEIGRDYEFTIKAVDADGLTSTSTVASTTVPSFVDNLYFYRDPRASSTEYLVDLYYTDYPFISDPYWSTPDDSWKVIIFYHNIEAVKGGILSTASAWKPADLEDVLSVKYNECSSGSLAENYRMILPDTTERCGVGGGLNNNARIWDDFEDNHLQVRVASSTSDVVFDGSEDYLTVAFYSFYQSGGGNQSLKLVAVDKTDYYFQNDPPTHDSPSTPSGLAIDSYTINSPTSTVEISWNASSDTDTLDSLLSYEWSLDDVSFEPVTLTSGGEPKKANLLLALGDTYDIFLRAVDDFNVTSGTTTVALTLPEAVVDTTPDPSNSYFAVDEAKIDNGLLKIKWRLISNPASNGVFGVIPYLTDVGAPTSTTIGNLRALHRDYGGNTIYPNTTANSAGQCNANITPFSDYTLGWQYETRFSTVSGTVVSDALVGEELQFALYATNATGGTGCSVSNVVDTPLFAGLPITISN
jgi:hypothetical protein